MKKRVEPVLLQILDAIVGIENAVQDRCYDDFQRDWLLNHGVQRGIEIISEASRRLPAELQQQHGDIPWRQIAGIGNILRHEYHDIQDDVIWDVVVRHLPPLKSAVSAMLADTTPWNE